MGAGELNHRIEIQVPTESQSESGQPIETFATVTTRWGEIKALAGNEAVKAKAISPEISHRIKMRTGYTIKSNYRLKHGERIFNIFPPIEDGNYLIIMAWEPKEGE